MNDQDAYLTALMQNLHLSSNHPENNNNGMRNQNQLRDAAGYYYCQSRDNHGRVVNNMRINNYYTQSAGIHNSSSSSNRNFPFQFATTTQAPITWNLTNGESSHVNVNYVINYSKFILQCFFADPDDAMTNIQTSDALMILLKTYDSTVVNAILEKILEYPYGLLIKTIRHNHGCQVIKELIQVSKELPRIIKLPKIFARTLLYVMNHQYGRHVIEQCLKQIDFVKSMPLYEEILKQWWALATNKYGCIALNNCMDSMGSVSSSSIYKTLLLANIAKHAKSLALDQYGIFVLQHLVPMNLHGYVYDKLIVEQLKPLLDTLCTSKSGSYLVEKYIATPFRSSVAEELIKTNRLVTIALDEFGNYTIQKLLKETKKHDTFLYGRLRNILLEELTKIECSPYSRNIAKILKEEERHGLQEYVGRVIRQQEAALEMERQMSQCHYNLYAQDRSFCNPNASSCATD